MLGTPEIGKKYRCTKKSGLNGKVVTLLEFSPCRSQGLHSIGGVKCPGYCIVKVEGEIGEESLCLCTYVTTSHSFETNSAVFWSIEPVEEPKAESRFIQKRMIRL